MFVDPKVFALACTFVDDTVEHMHREVGYAERRKFYEEAAAAMQLAIEGECQAIEDVLAVRPEAGS